MSLVGFHDIAKANDIAIIFMGLQNMLPMRLIPGESLINKLGKFEHNDMIGKPFGSRILSSKGGHVVLLYPTPELWTLCLPHRTQIIYNTDISMITTKLLLKPGAVVIEAGTGSGSLSHSLARCIMPTGHIYTFDFHEERANKARKEFNEHGLGELVTSQFRDVITDGFSDEKEKGIALDNVADAIFLDLPAPWLAIEHVVKSINKSKGGRFCSYSPCIEQVQKTAEALKANGFNDIQTFETLEKRFRVLEDQLPLFEFDDEEEEKAKETTDTKDENDCSHKRTASEVEKGNKQKDRFKKKRHTETKRTITARPYTEMKGHTAFLTFAQFWPKPPISVSEADATVSANMTESS